MHNTDFLIIGAGIVGLTLAREIKLRYPDLSVTVIEKEDRVGRHSSGRNSGVLHSGIYYPASSLKARVCGAGAKEMAEYCIDNQLPLNRLGKLLVPTRQEDAAQLNVLQERAEQNQVQVERLDEKQITEIEPDIHSATGSALYVPSTAVIDPKAILHTLIKEVETQGVKILYAFDLKSINAKQNNIRGSNFSIGYGHVINAAGLHADKIAHLFEVGKRYTLLPFKGLYWKLDPKAGFRIRHLIYPVPDLRVPFLGIHTTTAINGDIYLGPTAVPAFGRENYRGLEAIHPAELAIIMKHLTGQFLSGKNGFRTLAWQEGRRYFKTWFAEAAKNLIPALKSSHLLPTEKVAIRPQLLDTDKGELVNDFLIEKGENSIHILNAISPAFTSAFPFARYVLDNYLEQR